MNYKLDKILRHFVSLNDGLFSLYIAVKFLYLLSPLSQRCCQLPRGASRKGFTLKANYALYIMNCKLDKILRHFVPLNNGLFLYI